MSPNRHFVIDLFDPAVTLTDEGDLKTWIQGFPLGEWQHPAYGKIEMTAERVGNFVKNFHDKVRGTDLDVDYDHKLQTTKAAGWIEDARNDGPKGLSLLVEWTPSARKSLADKEFRYFSPEFVDTWKRPSDGATFSDVLFGGAITNRPFLKSISPINLSDFGLTQEGDDVKELMEALAKALGLKLSDDGDKDQTAVLEAIAKLSEKPTPPPAPPVDDQLKKLADDNPVIAQMLAERAEDRKVMARLEASNRLSEVTRRLGEVNTDKVGLPPAFSDSMRDLLVQVPQTLSDKIVTALGELTKTGLVQLGELGGKTKKVADEAGGDAIKAFNDAAADMVKADKISYREAFQLLAETKPELWDAYNEAQLQKVD